LNFKRYKTKEDISIKLEKIFLEHYDQWCLLSYSYLQNKIEAEEVVQDVCVRTLLRKKNTEILNLTAYISIAVKNRSLKKIKEKKRFGQINNFDSFQAIPLEEDLNLNEKKLFLKKVVKTLPDSTQKVFRLCILEEQKYKNVADTLGISVNTVKYHIKKAYKVIRFEMKNACFSIAFLSFSLLY
jgi:RNA polymerase sigma-70 factor (ECF subfamily)